MLEIYLSQHFQHHVCALQQAAVNIKKRFEMSLIQIVMRIGHVPLLSELSSIPFDNWVEHDQLRELTNSRHLSAGHRLTGQIPAGHLLSPSLSIVDKRSAGTYSASMCPAGK